MDKHTLAAAILQSASTSSDVAITRPLTMTGTLRTLIREEGFRGFYRGLLPNFLKGIPAVSVGYVVYEQTKKLLNVKTIR